MSIVRLYQPESVHSYDDDADEDDDDDDNAGDDDERAPDGAA
jgi:hypothetical protein